MPMPVDLTGKSLTERVHMGENVAALIEHPGFGDLLEVLGIYVDGVLTSRIYSKPDAGANAYAMGHLRGLREVESIARGVVENGKEAAAEQRRADEEGI